MRGRDDHERRAGDARPRDGGANAPGGGASRRERRGSTSVRRASRRACASQLRSLSSSAMLGSAPGRMRSRPGRSPERSAALGRRLAIVSFERSLSAMALALAEAEGQPGRAAAFGFDGDALGAACEFLAHGALRHGAYVVAPPPRRASDDARAPVAFIGRCGLLGSILAAREPVSVDALGLRRGPSSLPPGRDAAHVWRRDVDAGGAPPRRLCRRRQGRKQRKQADDDGCMRCVGPRPSTRPKMARAPRALDGAVSSRRPARCARPGRGAPSIRLKRGRGSRKTRSREGRIRARVYAIIRAKGLPGCGADYGLATRASRIACAKAGPTAASRRLNPFATGDLSANTSEQ